MFRVPTELEETQRVGVVTVTVRGLIGLSSLGPGLKRQVGCRGFVIGSRRLGGRLGESGEE